MKHEERTMMGRKGKNLVTKRVWEHRKETRREEKLNTEERKIQYEKRRGKKSMGRGKGKY